MSTTGEVIDNVPERRFELARDGHTAELVYRINGDRIVLIHTEVPEELSGQGVGGQLVAAAARRAARDGLTLVPLCPYARHWLETHPDDIGPVEIDWDTSG